jgi:hypothetical protein
VRSPSAYAVMPSASIRTVPTWKVLTFGCCTWVPL